MSTIQLTRGYVTVVDDADLPLLAGYRWHAAYDGRPTADGRRRVYAATTVGGRSVRMHRLLTGVEPGQLVDHINGDELDNRRVNLRICSHTENSRNARPQGRTTSSQLKGVTLRPSKKWRAQIHDGQRKIVLGDFESELFAGMVYDAAAELLHGQFAWKNLS